MGEETSIDLVSFEAKGLDEMVRLSWETGSEPSNAGFNLWRSDSREGQYVKINGGLIPAEGDATHGAEYSFEDMDVTRGRTYYYKLEDVSIYGTSGFHGPVSAHVPLLESHGCGMVADTGGSASVFAVLFAAVFAISGARRLSRRRRPYRKPEFRTVSGDEVLKKLGPAQTCSPTPAQCPTSD